MSTWLMPIILQVSESVPQRSSYPLSLSYMTPYITLTPIFAGNVFNNVKYLIDLPLGSPTRL